MSLKTKLKYHLFWRWYVLLYAGLYEILLLRRHKENKLSWRTHLSLAYDMIDVELGRKAKHEWIDKQGRKTK